MAAREARPVPLADRSPSVKIAAFAASLIAGLALIIGGGLALAPEGNGAGTFEAAIAVIALLYAGLIAWYFIQILRAPGAVRRSAGGEDPVDRSLASAYTEAEERLKQAAEKKPAPNGLQSLPWVAVLADSAGAGGFLRRATRHSPIANPRRDDPTETPHLRWFLAPEFAALDIDLAKTKGPAREETWVRFLRFLRTKRAGRAIDGIVALVSVDTLQAPAAHLGELGSELARFCDAAAAQAGSDIPVTVVITRCDLVPGIQILAGRLGTQALGQAVGWWPNAAQRQGMADETTIRTGIEQIDDRLRAAGLALIGRESDSAIKLSICESIESLARSLAALEPFLNAAFAGRRASRLGGVFLAGESIPGTMPGDMGLFVDDLTRRFVPRLRDLVA